MDHGQSPFSTIGNPGENALRAVVEDCLLRRAAGEEVSDEAVVAAHPELMPALGDELRRLRQIMAAREQSRAKTGPASSNGRDDATVADTRPRNLSDTGSGRLEVRCPNCRQPIDVAADTSLTDLTCCICGSHFSLVDQSKATRMAPPLSRLGRFELVERLGVGGFGSVWKARDKELDRTVAIKIPRQGGMAPEEQEKFFREARAAAQLRHPSIVSVHEVGRDGDSIYIVSDFVRGVTLGDWLTGQQLTSREAAELCAKIADGLHHAHQQGVVHRDLKPANIMIDPDGEPHLMDFGLARREAGEVTVTLDGHVLGTPAYMSPEQAEGKGHQADRRSDVYSLGVILFQLLTGELPFRGNARMLIHQVIHEAPPSPRKFNASIARDLETITLKCLEKDPSRRYQSALELAEELRRFLARKPILARPVGRAERAWQWCRRNPAIAAVSAALLVTLLTISTVAPIIAARQTGLRRAATMAEAAATREAASAKRLADVEGAKYALTQGRISDAYQQIASAIASRSSLEYGRILEEIVDQARSNWQLIQRMPCDQQPSWACFVGAGPKWLVVARGDSLDVRSVLTGASLHSIRIPGGSGSPRAIGGDHLAVATPPGKITIYSLPRMATAAECEMPGKVVEIRADATGRVIAALNSEALVRVFDKSGRQLAEKQFTPPDIDRITYPFLDVSPSGRAIVYDCGGSVDDNAQASTRELWLWESNETKPLQRTGQQSRFASDDVCLGIDLSEGIYVEKHNLKDGIHETFHPGEKSYYTDGAVLEGVGNGKFPLDVAVLCDEAIHLISASIGSSVLDSSAQMAVTRYDSLWPQGKNSPQFLAYDSATHTLALSVDQELAIFTQGLPAPTNEADVLNELETSGSILAGAGDLAFTSSGSGVERLDLRSGSRIRYELTSPECESTNTCEVRRLAVTPDARLLTVLWQESVNVIRKIDDSGLRRKIVQIYRLPGGNPSGPLSCDREFALDDFFGGSNYSNGVLMVSPRGNIVAWCDRVGLFGGYRVADGSRVYLTKTSPYPSYAFCPDPPLLGVGDYKRSADYQIWNVETGKLVSEIKGL